MKFLFTCGGTAGHINPALAVASHLKEYYVNSEFLFIGVADKMEMQLVPKAGFNILPLNITSISRGKSFKSIKYNIKTVFNVIGSFFRSLSIIRKFQPDVVIGTGGYVCFPVLMAAHFYGIPTVIHESNAYPGLTTRMLAKFADKIMVGVDESSKFYNKPEKVVLTGTPVRDEFINYTKDSARDELGFSKNEKIVLSFWGSLGAAVMNETVINLIPKLNGTGITLIHASGSRYYEKFIKELESNIPNYKEKNIIIYKYIHNMPALMTAADMVICRGGASTLSELCFIGKPSIIVPSPNVTDNHQEKNARVIENAGGAKVILEEDISEEVLFENILSILSDDNKLKIMGENAKRLSEDFAVEKICNEILSLVE